MADVIKMIRERKWDMLIFFGLVALLWSMTPLAVRGAVSDTIKESLDVALTPIVEDMEETRIAVQAIEQYNVTSLRNSAIVAYNKIKTVDDLEPLTQNGLAIREGLKNPDIREVLFSIDPERTLDFERFFAGQ